MTIRLLLEGITKRFPRVVALDRATVSVDEGEIHALLGENGAGKSTLMNIASGLLRPDEGRIVTDGVERRIESPRDAISLGIGMVHQHFTLVPILTVAENIAFGLPSRRGIVNLAPVGARVREFSSLYHIDVDPWSKVENLPVGVQQRVEILKALYLDAQILIFDEPTSLLTPMETDQLFVIMRGLAAEGRSIVFISHKLREVLAIADKITVLRKGKVQATISAADADERTLAHLMVGDREWLATAGAAPHSDHLSMQEPSVRMENVTVLEHRRPVLRNLSLEVFSGEILGIAGVEGNGQGELAEALLGLRKVAHGRISICGSDVRHSNVDLGVGFIPEDRQGAGLVMGLTVEENLILRRHNRQGLTRWGFFKRASVRHFAHELMREFDVAVSHGSILVTQLSGGNQQKVILARELRGNPRVIVASQPTRGLDIAATLFIHKVLRQHRDRGAAVLFISADLDEILEMSDRIAVLYSGQIVGLMAVAQANRQEIGLMMAGLGDRRVTPPDLERRVKT
jgi:ABC-type uncharacterized transport system ATPase subunit